MADLSSMSDDELRAAYDQAQSKQADLSSLSDDELRDAYEKAQRTQPPQPVDEFGRPMAGSSPEFDKALANSSIGKVMDAVGQGAKQGWGTEPLGLSAETEDALKKVGIFNDAQKGQHSIIRSFNEALMRPAAAALDATLRAGNAALGAFQAGVVKAGEETGNESIKSLTRDIAALPEAFPLGGHEMGGLGIHAKPFELKTPADLETARSYGVLGTEAEWKGVAPTEDFPAGTTARVNVPAEAKMEGEGFQPYQTSISPDVQAAAAPTNIHEAARAAAPDTFREYDALTEAREQLSNHIAAETEALRQSAEAQMPGADRIADLEARIQQMTPRMAERYAEDLKNRIADIRGGWDQDQLAMLGRDTPEIAALRQQLQQIDYRMRDLAPDVTAAYREAEKQFPTVEETAVETPQETHEAVPETAPEATPEAQPVAEQPQGALDFTKEPEPVTQAEPEQVTLAAKAEPVNIAEDVTQKLVAAGRPEEEARASAAVSEALWRTRAQRFGGAKGTAEEMYAREAPEIRAGKDRKKALEFAQTRRQTAQGKIKLTNDGHAVITLFRDANASTFLHEMGHDWLERTMRDAVDADATAEMKRDAEAIRKYLNLNEGDALSTKAHEKFARSFERYFMEGRAPSSALARVFEQFKDWLTTIYETVAKLRAPITDDIRDVFDRMLTTTPEERPILAPEIEEAKPAARAPMEDKGTPLLDRVPKEPTRLSAFIRKMGGVQEESGEFKALLGGDYRNLPGLANSAGMSHDLMAIEAMHAGYFPGIEEQHMLPPNILMDKLREDLTGNPQYSMHDQEAVQQYYDAIKHNAEVDRLATQYGVDTKGMTREQFFGKLAEELSFEKFVEEMRSIEDAHEDEFGYAASEAREWAEAHEDVWDTGEDHGIEDTRTDEELENAYGPENGARPAGESAINGPKSAAAGRHTGEGEVSGGQGGHLARDAGRAGEEVRQSVAGEAGNGQRSGTGGAESVSPGGERAGVEPKDFRTKEDREIEKAANIRLDKLNTPEDMSDALKALAEQNGDFMDARYGTAAYQMQMDIRNTRILLRSATSEMMEASVKAATGDEAAIADWITKQQRAAMVFQHLSTLSADWAHAGHELNKVMEGWDRAKGLAQQIQDTTGKTLFQLQQEAKAMAAMPTPEQAAKFASDLQLSRGQRIKNGVLAYFINNLISGPITHGSYAIGNFVMSVYRAVPETVTQAAVGAIRGGPDRVYFGEAGAQIYAMFRGAADGISPAWQALKTGVPVLPNAQGEFAFAAARTQSIPGKFGYIAETPSRAVSAIHTFFYSMGYSQEIARLAFRDAAARGLTGDAFTSEVARLTQSPSSAMMEAADQAATRGVLMKRPEYGSARYHLSQLVNQNFAAKLVLPFMQVGLNILEEGIIDRTPLAMLSADARAELMGAKGGAARDLRIGKIATGSMLATGVVGLAAGGIMTGGGPVDPNQRRILLDSGWQPYSLRVGDTYIPYRKFLGPLGPLVGTAADIYEVGHTLTDEGLTKAAAALGFGFSEVVASETWMSGLSNFVEAVRNWDTKGETYLRGLATDFIPFSIGMQQIAKMVDPYQRQASTLLEAARGKIPFASEGLQPRIGPWGQPVGGRMFGMVTFSHATHDPVDARLQALGIGVAPIGKSVTGIRLSEEQYTRLQIVAGRMAHERLTVIVTQPGFDQLPAGIQTKVIQETITKSREAARSLIKMESPDIIQQATQNKINLKVSGRHGAQY